MLAIPLNPSQSSGCIENNQCKYQKLYENPKTNEYKSTILNSFEVFIIIKSGTRPIHAKSHILYPGALSDNKNPDKQIKNNFNKG
jgi:hypothetical protein